MAIKVGDKMQCQTCHGKGYRVEHSWAGYSYPRICNGCRGTGQQEVRK